MTANYKETQLARIKAGMPVDISVDACGGKQALSLGIFGLIPAVGDLIATEELAYARRASRPTVTHDFGIWYGSMVTRQPGSEEVIEYWIELLFRWIPGLE